MPELPEVETIKRQLVRKIIGKELKGKKITNVRRRAKLLIIDFNDSSSLIFHLKLTGQIIFNKEPSPSTRKVFYFKDGSRLIFNDTRKFGWWKTVKNSRKIEGQFGPEALEINLMAFKDILKKHPGFRIKSLLMDQGLIAGIGNIYSSEILYTARINPLRRAGTLSGKEIGRILQGIKKILRAAIRHQGSSVEYYVDACGEKGDFVKYHKVYQRNGQKCLRCAGPIKKIKIGSRSTYFCPRCQPIR